MKKEMNTDSTTEELEEEEASAAVDPKFKRFALANVVGGYLLAAAFVALVAFNAPEASDGEKIAADDPDGLFVEKEGEIASANEVADPDKPVIELFGNDRVTVPLGGVYVEPGFKAKAQDGTDLTQNVVVTGQEKINTLVPGVSYPIDYMVEDTEGNTKIVTRYVQIVDNRFASDIGVGIDRGTGVILDDPGIAVIDNPNYVVTDHGRRLTGGLGNNVRGSGVGGIGGPDVVGYGGGAHLAGGDRVGIVDDIGNTVDLTALDRAYQDEIVRVREEEYGVDVEADPDFRGLDVDRRRNAGDIDFGAKPGDFADEDDAIGDGYDIGKGGKLYAYNTPSLGVGAGIGAPALGAGVGAAGIGAGIGQASLDGKPVPALGGTGTYVPPANSAPAGPDADGDTIPDALESAFKTNPAKADTDGDGFSDADEVKGLSNPRDPRSTPQNPAPTGEPDADGDGLPTSIEIAYGTNPLVADTDGDGFNDGQELSSMTVPTDPKSNPGAPGIGGPAMAMGPGVAGGVGGLVSGAGVGGAAGLISGMVKQPLGLGIGCESCGDKGCADCAHKHPAGCGCGHHGGHGGDFDFEKRRYDELPPDGNLWIMMHVDGSGSIQPTREALVKMRETIMKNALLPYYMNDENLYNRRVLIVDGKGERTLR
ncbi:MAG: immunoglobulin-like domain-containing protein, partial [Opitutales bacterium]